jgi:NADPH2:quinone reductase
MALQEKGSLYLTRANALPWFKEYPRYLEQLVPWLQQGRLTIRIAGTYPLAEAPAAHEAFEQRKVSGRLLLIP